MIGLDTNILVRYITQDDAQQSQRANQIIEQCCSKASTGYIAQVVLCELVWVLHRAYGYDKQQVISVLDQILVTTEFTVEYEDLARKALEAWRKGAAGYSDYLLVFANQAAGCELTYSFNTKLALHPMVSTPP